MPRRSRTACRSIGTNAGAIPGTVPPDAGLLVAPDDAPAFASALRRLIGNADERQRFADAAREAASATADLAGLREIIRARAGGRDMTGFSADWLTLREPFDMRARNPSVLDAVAASLATYPSVRIVDLACGTGSTLRALSARLPASAELEADRQRSRPAGARDGNARIPTMWPSPASRSISIATSKPRSTGRSISSPPPRCSISSPKPWLERLAVEIAARKIPFYAALSYEGTIDLTPRDPLDAAVIAAINAHQRTDKGFGPALGPAAADAAIARFESLGYSVKHGRSDWVIGPQDQDMQNEILAGWAHAAREIDALTLAGYRGLADTAPRHRCRRTLITPRRSCRRLCNADRNALSRQIAVVQHFVFDLMDMHGHTQRLIGAFDRRQREAGVPRTKNDRRHHHVQPIETTGGKKSRYRHGAAFDQHPAKPMAGQRGKDRRGSDLPVTCRQGNRFNAGWRRAARALRNDQQTARPIGSKHLGFAAEPAFRVDDHARRMRPGHAPHGELRIVGDGGADAYNYTVDERPQPVQMGEARRAVDVFRVPGFGRDAAIEGLADLADHHEIVHGALPQWAKYSAPGLRQRLVRRAENIAKVRPRVARPLVAMVTAAWWDEVF